VFWVQSSEENKFSELDVTAQIPESLRYQGEQFAMRAHPLDCYFSMVGISPGFEMSSTALWRGYVGTWEITDGRLYLVALWGTLHGGSEVCLATFFPVSTAESFQASVAE
jgi:hypothetical protein